MTYKSLSLYTENPAFQFSICCITTNMEEYTAMRQSFESRGFIDGCEFIIADNSQGNRFDAYQSINRFIRESQGKYLVIVHQDVRCADNRAQLEKCLEDLELKDNNWAICGNAGVIGYHQQVMHINNNGRIMQHANLPAKVRSLDENLLIINKSKPLVLSSDIGGFHFYGTDLCIIADFLGYSSYVIPFMVKHLSLGNLKDLDRHAGHFIHAYGSKFRGRFMQTTCTKFYLSNSVVKNRIYNFPPVFFLVKTVERIKFFAKRIGRRNPHKKSVSQE